MSTPPRDASNISVEDLLRCTEIFEAIVADPIIVTKLSTEERNRLFIVIGRSVRPDQDVVRRKIRMIRNARNDAKREADRAARSTTTIRTARTQSVFVPPPLLISDESDVPAQRPDLQTPDHCYIRKSLFTNVHHFYDSLCPVCAKLNYDKRFQSASLAGRVAVITGARLKIRYQAALMMLRAGAAVHVTTRFPVDAAIRYSKEDDYSVWGSRLQIYGLELRHSPSVEAFTGYLNNKLSRLDIIINNAAQTVRRPPGFYAHMMSAETQPTSQLSPQAQQLLAGYQECRRILSGGYEAAQTAQESDSNGTKWIAEWHKGKLPAALGVVAAAELSQIPYACDEAATQNSILFPEGKLDADLQQVDLRSMNSWRMTLADVPTAELLEVQLINSIAPFILCSKLKPLMMRDRTNEKHIVNVSAMEGKFNRGTKTDKHPHTNMAKAALNMITLTSARDYANCGIFMNAVDTGWVTDEDPAELSARKQRDHDFQPPLDIVDGAARVMDPIFAGLRNGQHM